MKIKEHFNLYTGVFLIAGGLMLSKPSITSFDVLGGNAPLPNILSIALILIGIFELSLFFKKTQSK